MPGGVVEWQRRDCISREYAVKIAGARREAGFGGVTQGKTDGRSHG